MTSKLKDKDGFSLVSYKGKKKKYAKPPPSSLSVAENSPNFLHNFDLIMKDIQYELKQSDFMNKFKEDFHEVLTEWCMGNLISLDSKESINVPLDFKKDSIQNIDILCYGLGQFSSCVIARYQLGFLMLLKQILHSTHVYIYDPQFSIEEINFLKESSMVVLNINEEAKRLIKGKSVCFMPHCDLPLYNNLLWANWNVKNLSELAIIGNSFENYQYKDAEGRLKQKAKYVYLANEFLTEISVKNTFRFTDIFNDLSIHHFKYSSLNGVDPFIWIDIDEPEYSDEDFIKKC